MDIVNFKQIYSQVKIVHPGNGRWRAGIVFENENNTREYIFHAYQDEGSNSFKSRIVERETGIKEISPDVNKTIGIRKNPFSFEFWIECKKDQFIFYIDGTYAGSYAVPQREIAGIFLAAWSDQKPIKVLFNNIKVIA